MTTPHADGLPIPTVLFDERVPVHYGFINLSPTGEITEDGDPSPTRAGQSNGLCGAKVPHVLHMVTGLHTGDVPIKVAWSPTEPAVGDGWEDIVEVSVEIPQGDLVLSAFEDFVEVVIPATGHHRARYSAKNMDAGHDLDTPDEGEAVPDSYLLELWPARAAADRVVRQTSATAEYWHSVARDTPA